MGLILGAVFEQLQLFRTRENRQITLMTFMSRWF